MKRLTATLAGLGTACLLAAQFIPDKTVVIHPAVESPPELRGPMLGPGTGLGATQAIASTASAGRSGPCATGRGPPAIPPPPPAPEINAAGSRN